MSLKVKVKSEADFPPIPEGTYTAICYTIADLGMQYNEKFKKTAHKILFIWELDDDEQRIDIDGEKKRRAISKQYTASFATKSNMYKDIRPWIGREFTPEEMEGTFDVGTLLGTACMISVINETNAEGKVYSAISSIMQLPKGIKVGKPENPMVLYDMDESPDEELEKLPEWVQEKIKKSKNADLSAANSIDIKVDPETGEVISDKQKPATVDDLP
ncbi:MAG: hypothetical protein BWY46_01403 [Firmicutes bacterium ADurb.Bin300]|nr:MAG: hypothetical protein BWY46_01403 [Firmicutes bacterium ADurb.Bin300]